MNTILVVNEYLYSFGTKGGKEKDDIFISCYINIIVIFSV